MFLPFLREGPFVVVHLSLNLKAGCAEAASVGVRGIELVSDSAHTLSRNTTCVRPVGLWEYRSARNVTGSLLSCWAEDLASQGQVPSLVLPAGNHCLSSGG